MELDERIIQGKKPLDCFDAENKELIKPFLNKEGYVSNNLENFCLLDWCFKRLLSNVFKERKSCFTDNEGRDWKFFLPVEWVKESERKYRPYTLNEFQDQFHFGICIILQPKNDRSMEFHVTYNGYKVLTDRNIVELYLGPAIFTLSELFDEYERFENGRWLPFGVLVEEDE